jgi:hypothetical protein
MDLLWIAKNIVYHTVLPSKATVNDSKVAPTTNGGVVAFIVQSE